MFFLLIAIVLRRRAVVVSGVCLVPNYVRVRRSQERGIYDVRLEGINSILAPLLGLLVLPCQVKGSGEVSILIAAHLINGYRAVGMGHIDPDGLVLDAGPDLALYPDVIFPGRVVVLCRSCQSCASPAMVFRAPTVLHGQNVPA